MFLSRGVIRNLRQSAAVAFDAVSDAVSGWRHIRLVCLVKGTQMGGSRTARERCVMSGRSARKTHASRHGNHKEKVQLPQISSATHLGVSASPPCTFFPRAASILHLLQKVALLLEIEK